MRPCRMLGVFPPCGTPFGAHGQCHIENCCPPLAPTAIASRFRAPTVRHAPSSSVPPVLRPCSCRNPPIPDPGCDRWPPAARCTPSCIARINRRPNDGLPKVRPAARPAAGVGPARSAPAAHSPPERSGIRGPQNGKGILTRRDGPSPCFPILTPIRRLHLRRRLEIRSFPPLFCKDPWVGDASGSEE